MKRLLVLPLSALFFAATVSAQPMGPGSIAFLAIQTDAPDAFAFVVLQDIAANDTLYFTDNGWSGTEFFTNEQTVRWYSSTPVPRGTVIRITDPDDNTVPDALVSGPGTTIGKLNNLSASGEQVLAYKIAGGGGYIHLAGISTRNWLETCNTTGTGNTNATCLPSTLTNGITAFAYSATTTDIDNFFYNIPSTTGTVQSILSGINGNAMNWLGNNEPAVAGADNWPAWTFNFSNPGPGDTSSINFSSSTYTVAEGQSLTITLSINPPAPQPGNVSVAVNAGAGVTGNDYTTTPPAVSGSINLEFGQGASTVTFQFQAGDDSEAESTETVSFSIASASAGFATGTVYPATTVQIIDNDAPAVVPVLFINELMSSNSQAIEDNPGEFDDWFELYNPGTGPVDIGGLYITDDRSNPAKFRFPTGDESTIIPAGGFLLIWADNTPAQGPLHTSFALSANGEFLGLYAESSAGIVLIDSIGFPALEADHSFGRQTDGGLPWVDFAPGATTPGTSNQSAGMAGADNGLSITIYPNPSMGIIHLQPGTDVLSLSRGFSIADITGRILITKHNEALPATIDCSALDNGVYLLILHGVSGHSARRFVISR